MPAWIQAVAPALTARFFRNRANPRADKRPSLRRYTMYDRNLPLEDAHRERHSKHIPPEETFRIARERIARMGEPILDPYEPVHGPSATCAFGSRSWMRTGTFLASIRAPIRLRSPADSIVCSTSSTADDATKRSSP